MRVIIAGSRGINNINLVKEAVAESGFEIDTVICGMCRGVDLLGGMWATRRSIPVIEFPADWEPNGVFDKAAGYKRNVKMAENADALIAVMEEKGTDGTQHMIDIAKRKGLKVYVKLV